MAILFTPGGYGAPASGDQVYFYDGDTTTPATVYEDVDLVAELGTSVTADADGAWPNIYLDPEVTYKAAYVRDGGDVSDPIKTTYPVNPPFVVADGSITADMLATDAAADNLGYTPVDKAGDTMSGDLILDFTPTALDPRSVGFRGAGQSNTQNGTYTFVLADTGRLTKKSDTSTPTWTIPPNSGVAFPVGTVLVVTNLGASGSVTIARGSGVALRANGTSSSADLTLAAYSGATLLKVDTDSWLML